jgi:hypothetical protein
MVHLAVAIELSGLKNLSPSPDFLLGCIAPDAIHMRPGFQPSDKPVVHLWDSADPGHERVRRLLLQQTGSAQPGFAEGYAIHLLTDRLWFETAISPFQKCLPEGLSPQERRALYYQETDQNDFDLYHQSPWRAEVWQKLEASQPQDFAGLLSADEIARWRDRNLHWFGELKAEPGITPKYITRQVVTAFILQAARDIDRIFQDWGVRL